MDKDASRGDKDPFHILLLGETFQQPRITIADVVIQLCYTLDMPEENAFEHAQFAKEQGLSCLGTWKREECLELGAKLRLRGIVCRVVPYAEGGRRSWQANRPNLPGIAANCFRATLGRVVCTVILRKLSGSIIKKYFL